MLVEMLLKNFTIRQDLIPLFDVCICCGLSDCIINHPPACLIYPIVIGKQPFILEWPKLKPSPGVLKVFHTYLGKR